MQLSVKPISITDLSSKKKVQEHYDNNRDFIVYDMFSPYYGMHVSKSELEHTDPERKQPIKKLKVRYAKDTKVMFIDVKINPETRG